MDELETLLPDGLDVSLRKIPVRVIAIVSDFPANSILKLIQGHSGRQACGRCNVMDREEN